LANNRLEVRVFESLLKPDHNAEQDNRLVARHVLFLQGPISPFFKLMADKLEMENCRCFRINLCFGDWLFWRGREATQFRGRQSDWPAFIERYLIDNAITDIVLLGEQRFYHKEAIRLAQSMAIQVIATDFGYLRPDWITFEKNGMSSSSRFPKCPEAIMALAQKAPQLPTDHRYSDSFVQQVVWDMQYHLLSTLCALLYPGYRSHQIYHPIFVYLGTGYRLLLQKLYWRKKAEAIIEDLRVNADSYVVLPLQMQNDFQIRAYSQFDNLQHAIKDVLVSFAKHAPAAMKLVVKIHPLDPGLINWRRFCDRLAHEYELGGRVVYVDGGSLDRLIDGAQGVVTINSTVGIWALRRLKPVCVLGEAIYRVKGLVGENLDRFWVELRKPDKALTDAFFKAIAGYLHVRGVYYGQPGLANAVEEAAARLLHDKVNDLMIDDDMADHALVQPELDAELESASQSEPVKSYA
jgi:capsular polysaccharide export protein